ncbi:4Fe-4S ferredoxin iron-sulfur binding domain protein [Desulfonatronospira thiodismutans ASO3-1]|uniref:4Fe-4S ferredoxin iron-sulfur binding domain protein n=1 Tax=Desulfonatronospira thiodismutans ASO3-1 TaxID=555779 RepID=D6STG6_9BACT|nr:DUF362 domain-containing protein [Desulfonatronospira thiodismutans]EFI33982.1 4Fe-4S ferredoxin iron-sulfur binding domain protein [Desulfonatronospira thiodismutans ASO3-1]
MSKVYFWNLRASRKMPYDLRLKKLLKKIDLGSMLEPGMLTAVKIHFGEGGTTGFVSPLWVRPVVEFIKKTGARPFLTDTNTLYVGNRGEAVSHHMQAAMHGFDPNVLGAPVIIADGLRSNNQRRVSFEGRHLSEFYLAGDIMDADFMVNVSHFKGHELSGFGGALKNLAMGCATRQGKMHQHSGLAPKVDDSHCQGCGLCMQVCASGALTLVDEKVRMDPEKCVGCAACILVCKTGALQINWETEGNAFLERMMEYSAAVLSRKKDRCVHINYIFNVTPDCDCPGFSDAPLCPDLGVLASLDPVALDRACLDLVNQAQPLHPSALPKDITPGQDKFTAAHPKTNGSHALDYAHDLGLGSQSYELAGI